MAGKGSRPRPINKKVFDQNFDEIMTNPNKKEQFVQVRVKGKTVWRKVYK